MERNWRRFRTSRLALVVGFIIDLVLLALYIICLQALESLSADTAQWQRTALDVISNVLLVGFSVLTTSLISIPFIDVRGKNNLCSEMLLGDVLKTPAVFNALPSSQKEEILRSLECSAYFDNCIQKEEMFSSIKRKFSGGQSAKENDRLKDCFFESCDYDVVCTVEDGYIKKHITKTFDLRAYKKTTVEKFPLCSSTFTDIPQGDGSIPIVDALNIGGVPRDLTDVVSEAGTADSGFDKRSGYGKNVAFYFKGKLKLDPDQPTKIMVSYKTQVPEYDVAYSCRMVHPCHTFHFRFHLEGPETKAYSLAVNAFGFWDDGKKSPNNNDLSTVNVDFGDWIFPRDGVSVTLIRKAPADGEDA